MNGYGWTDAEETAVLEQTADGATLTAMIKKYAVATNNAHLLGWMRLDDEVRAWSSMAAASPDDYRDLMRVVPATYLAPGLAERIDAHIREPRGSHDASLFDDVRTNLAQLANSLWVSAKTVFNFALREWMETELQLRRPMADDPSHTMVIEGRVAAPDTFEVCWQDRDWHEEFAAWARASGLGGAVDFIVWVEQSYAPTPTWTMARHLLTTHLFPGAESPASVSLSVVEAIADQTPVEGSDGVAGEPPGDLFAAAAAEIWDAFIARYAMFRAQVGTPAADRDLVIDLVVLDAEPFYANA